MDKWGGGGGGGGGQTGADKMEQQRGQHEKMEWKNGINEDRS